MAKLETRRINPIAHVTLVVVTLVVVFELLMIGGILELKSATVAKYAPWAYEPFLKLVGEHPDSVARWAPVEETEVSDGDILSDGLPDLPVTNDTTSATNAAPEPEPPPVDAPTNMPPADPEEFIPVG